MSTDNTDGGVNENDGSAVQVCLRDSDCNSNEFCLREGSGRGECAPGCRDDDSCGADQICDPDTRICRLPPCEGDTDCPEDGTYCAANGDCNEGCRADPDSCEPNPDNGRFTACDEETRVCVDVIVCCEPNDTCSQSVTGECSGQALMGAQACSQNPCGEICVEDSDCGDDLGRFCNTQDGLCRNGCRVDDPQSCAEGQICDDLTRECIDIPCGIDSDCPSDRYCDFRSGQGLCALGCRGDDSCEATERCENNECITVCNPEDPTSCPDGQYCTDLNRCAENCETHNDCGEGLYCDAVLNQCLLGCRDDEGDNGEPNNINDDATLIPLTAPDADGVQFGSLDSRVLCDNDADVYRVNVDPGKRLRVTLTYDLVGAPGFTLEGDSGSCQNSGDCANLIQWVCNDEARTCVSPIRNMAPTGLEAIMEYPPLPGQNTGGADVVNDNASYYITVEPTIDTRFQYRIDIAVADATASCFPDARESGAGDDIRSNGTEIPVLGGRSEFSATGTSCGNDTDWFKINLNPNDGLQLDLRKDGGDDLDVFLIAANQNIAAPLASTSEPNTLPYLEALDSNAFLPGGEWHIGIKSEDGGTSAYTLDVVHFPSNPCAGVDQGDTIPDASMISPNLDMVQEVGASLGQNTQICNEGARGDVDYFCFDVEEGERLDAWLFTVEETAQPGEVAVQFTDGDGGLLGSEALSTLDSEAPIKARYIGTQSTTYCARVAGVDGGDGDYRLFINRVSNSGGQCALDIAEEFGRNDRGSSATLLTEQVGTPGHYQFNEGYICDLMRSDEDWYQFNVPETRANICVLAQGFDGSRADIDLSVYPSANQEPINCTAQGQLTCDRFVDPQTGMMGAGACVPDTRSNDNQSYCAAYKERSFSLYDFEMVHISRGETADVDGDFFVRVTHRDESEGPYTLSVNVNPNADACADDGNEINNTSETAKFLGSAPTAMCDTWVCDSERRSTAGDWFEVEVPAGQDRTILVDYAQTEGRLEMNAQAPHRIGADGQVLFDMTSGEGSGNAASFFRSGGRQCILIKGGTITQPVQFQVFASSIGRPVALPDNNRVDYAIRVLPADLDAAAVGQCNLGRENAPRAACGLWETWMNGSLGRAQPDDCWPLIELP